MSISSNVVPRYSMRAARHDLEVADLLGGVRAAVGLDEADDDVGAALVAPPALVEHRERLADAGRRSEVDAELPACHRRQPTVTDSWSSARLSSSTLTPGSPRKPSERPSVWSSIELVHLGERDARAPARRGAPAGGRWRPRCAGRARTPTRSPRRPAPPRPRRARSPCGTPTARCFTAASRSGLVGPEVRARADVLAQVLRVVRDRLALVVRVGGVGAAAAAPGRARAAVEVLRLREGLAEQRRADDLAVRP